MAIMKNIPKNKIYPTFNAALNAAAKMKGVYKILPDDDESKMIYGDDLPLFSAVHKPWPYPFHIRIWNWIKAIFVRPKFSKEALEPYEPRKEEKEYVARVFEDFEKLGIFTGPKKGERIKPCTCMACRAYMTNIGKPDYWKE